MFKVFGYIPSVYNCAPCMNAKRLLDAKGYEYEFISVADSSTGGVPNLNEHVIDELEVAIGTRRMTMPQIFKDGQHIGGFDQLKEYIRNLP